MCYLNVLFNLHVFLDFPVSFLLTDILFNSIFHCGPESFLKLIVGTFMDDLLVLRSKLAEM